MKATLSARAFHPLVPQAIAVSAMVHVGVLGALAAWQVREFDFNASRIGRGGEPQLVMTFVHPAAEPATLESVFFEPPVLVTSERTHTTEQSFVEMPSTDTTLEEMMAVDSMQVAVSESTLNQLWTDRLRRPDARSIRLLRAAQPIAADVKPLGRPPRAEEAAVLRIDPQVNASERLRPRVDERTRIERDHFVATLPRQATRVTPPPPGKPLTLSSVQGSGVTTPPDFRGNELPSYPVEARVRRFEGLAKLRLHVNQLGRVTHVEVLETSGYAILDAAAVAAVRNWHGKPALRGGLPVADAWDLPVQFRLN